MKNTLFICNTHYQLLLAVFLKFKDLSDYNVDIIITDHIKGSEILVENLKELKLFRNVFYQKTKSNPYLIKTKHKIINKLMPSKSLLAKYISKEKYDHFFLYNVDLFSEIVFAKLQVNNKNLIVNLYDEGVSTYSKLYYELLYGKIKRNTFNKILFFLLRKNYIANAAKYLYLVDPDLLCWKFNGEVKKINLPDFTDENVKKIVNKIYSLNEIEEVYKGDYIIFEESFYEDKKKVNDLEVFEEILSLIEPKEVLVKIHPRNSENRFKALGITTNENFSIPWEIISINLDGISNKSFITITSTAAITTLLLYGFKYKIILLYDYNELNIDEINKEYFEFFDKVRRKYGEMVAVPRNIEELRRCFNEKMGNLL